MLYTQSRPLKILTPLQTLTSENWSGETPVEILHADGWDDAGGLIQGIDVMLGLVFTKEMGEIADSLKFIQTIGAGIDRIDLAALPKGCSVANVCGDGGFRGGRSVGRHVCAACVHNRWICRRASRRRPACRGAGVGRAPGKAGTITCAICCDSSGKYGLG